MTTWSPPIACSQTPSNCWCGSTPFQVRNGEGGSGTDGEAEPRVRVGDRVDGEILVEDHPLAFAARALILLLQRAEHTLGRDRKLGHPNADRVVDGGGDRRRLRVVRHLADP